MNPVLTLLDVPEIYKIFIFVASARGIFERLDAQPAIRLFREQRFLQQISDTQVEEAIAIILAEFRPGYVLPREPVLCALLVGLHTESSALSQNIITEAASIQSASAHFTALIAQRCKSQRIVPRGVSHARVQLSKSLQPISYWPAMPNISIAYSENDDVEVDAHFPVRPDSDFPEAA